MHCLFTHAHRLRWWALPLVLAASAAQADQSLQTALDAYWLRHPAAQSLGARADAARAAQSRAHGLLADAPTVSLSRLDDRDGGGRETEFELALPLAGDRSARQQQAAAGQNAVDAEARWLRLSLAAELLRVDGERRHREELLGLNQQRRDVAEALAQNVRQKVQAGELARTDELLAGSEALAAGAAVLNAEQAAEEARNAWAWRVGPTAALADEPLTIAPSADAVDTAAAVDAHPQLQLLLATASAAAARAQFERRHTGDAELSLLMKREEDSLLDERIDSAGVRLSLPIFTGSTRSEAAASADAERLRAEAEARQLREQLQQEQIQARRQFQRSEQRHQLADQQLQLNRQNWQHAQAAFAAGELPLAELLRQQQRLFDSHESLSLAKQQQREALARLILAEGALP